MNQFEIQLLKDFEITTSSLALGKKLITGFLRVESYAAKSLGYIDITSINLLDFHFELILYLSIHITSKTMP